jgi:hypothetical protein
MALGAGAGGLGATVQGELAALQEWYTSCRDHQLQQAQALIDQLKQQAQQQQQVRGLWCSSHVFISLFLVTVPWSLSLGHCPLVTVPWLLSLGYCPLVRLAKCSAISIRLCTVTEGVRYQIQPWRCIASQGSGLALSSADLNLAAVNSAMEKALEIIQVGSSALQQQPLTTALGFAAAGCCWLMVAGEGGLQEANG